jgi:probable phosphoglycerate mutase
MPVLHLLRHGPTEWTAARRLQGRSDVPLSTSGRRAVETWELPADAARGQWISSPLARAAETAAILRRRFRPDADLLLDPRLVEMSFGEWEGQTLAELRSLHGPAMAALEGRGLDFRAPGGESPRDVQDRLRPWLDELATSDKDGLAITHKAVLRALYAFASGWDMRGKPPQRLLDNAVHQFELQRGELRIRRLNIALHPHRLATEASP